MRHLAPTLIVLLLAALPLAACAAEEPGTTRDGNPTENPTGTHDASTGLPPATGADGGRPVQNDSCRHLDIVFSVDPSGSMTEELEFLRAEIFPELARTLMGLEGVEDFRVGVMDACWSPPAFHTMGRGGECAFSSGSPWMESSSPDIASEFACVGNLHGEDDDGYSMVSDCTGGDSDNEHPATAAMYAVEAAAAGEANAGFLRDDAVLVVFALTDEDEQPGNGPGALTAEQIFNRIVTVKRNPRAVAFLGIGGATSCDGVYGSADEAELLKETTARFADWDRGLFWDLCGGNLGEGVARVVELIERACEEYTGPCDEFAEDTDWTDCYETPPPMEQPPLI